MDKLKKILPYLLGLVLIWTNLQTQQKVTNLEQTIGNFRHQMNNTTSQVSSIRNMIQKDLDEDNILESFDFTVTENTDLTSDIHLNIALKELPKDAEVYLTYKEVAPKIYYSDEMEVLYDDIPSNENKRLQLTHEGDLNFSGTFPINKKFSYELKAVIENDDYMKSVTLNNLELFHKYYPDVNINLRPHQVNSDGMVHYSCNLDIYNPTNIEFLSAICSIKYKGKSYDTFDLMKETSPMTDGDEEPIVFYELDRKYTFELNENETLSFDDLSYEMIVETNAGITYKYTWTE